jgi:hypothetical protein
MHSAPAVSYPVGRSRFQGWLVGLTCSGGVLAGLLWRYQTGLAGWRQWLFAMIMLGTSVAAARAWRRAPQGSLRWDGQAWSWTARDASVCGVLAVHLDLQFCMVLSLRTDTGARRWFWPERRAEVALWQALRRAVFSRGGADQPPDAGADVDWAHR